MEAKVCSPIMVEESFLLNVDNIKSAFSQNDQVYIGMDQKANLWLISLFHARKPKLRLQG